MNTEQPIIIERVYNAPASKIWQALTEPAEMKKWYFDVPDFKAEEGLNFKFSIGPSGKAFLHSWTITNVEPAEKISYRWDYPDYEGSSEVCFELNEAGPQTTLRLTHEGLDSFPKTVPELAKENFIHGWEQILGSNLKNYLSTTAEKTH